MPKKKKKEWEPPQFVWSIRGPIPVEYTDSIQDEEGRRLAGCANLYERKITLDAGLPQEETEVILLHEALHLWAHDSGFDDLFRHLEEPFIQSLATYLVSYGKFTR